MRYEERAPDGTLLEVVTMDLATNLYVRQEGGVEVERRQLTTVEQAILTADAAALTAEANERTIRSQIGTGLTTLQGIIDTAQPTVTSNATAQTAIRALQAQVKDIARIQRRMLRLLDRRLDSVD